MANGNTVTLVGNLTREPEQRYTNSGQSKVTLGLAVNRRWQRNGEWEEATSFFNVIAWGDLGDNVVESLDKGARVLVTGRLEQRSWETDNGDKRSVVEVVADEIGPSLRWATAEVTKVERGAGGGGGRPSGGGGGGGGGYDQPAGVGSHAGEEPF